MGSRTQEFRRGLPSVLVRESLRKRRCLRKAKNGRFMWKLKVLNPEDCVVMVTISNCSSLDYVI